MISLVLSLWFAQAPRFHEGDHWSMDRTVRFVNSAEDIDIQNDDRFDFRVVRSDDKLSMKVDRLMTATHLPGGVTVASPPDGQPEEWTIPIPKDGKLVVDRQPKSGLERILLQVFFAAWNGESAPREADQITVKLAAADRVRVVFDGKAVQNPARLEGEMTFDPTTRAPVLFTLRGDNVSIPGGDLRASVKVEYRRSDRRGP